MKLARLVALTLALMVAAILLPGGRVSAAPISPPANVVGSSCVLAATGDPTSITTATASSVVFKLKCRWNAYDAGRASVPQALRPFNAGGCLSTTVCTDQVPVEIWFQEYTGTPASDDLTIRHGSGNRGVFCNVTDFAVVGTIAASATTGEWSWRCSSVETWFGSGGAVLANSLLTWSMDGSGSTTVGTSIGIGGGRDVTAGSPTAWTGSVNTSTFVGFAAADEFYSWGPVDPDPFCDVLVVGVVDAGVTLLQGDTYSPSVLATGYTSVPSGTVLSYRWSFADSWKTYTPPLLATLPLSPSFVNMTGGAVVPSSGFEIRCVRTGETTTYTGPDGTGAQTTPNPARACSLVSVTWPRFPLEMGVSYTFGFRVSPGAPGPSAGITAFGVGFEEDYQSRELVNVPSWSTLATIPVSDTFPAFSGDAGTFAVTVPTLPKTTWANGEVFFVCTDSLGTITSRSGSDGNGVFNPRPEDAQSYEERFDSCLTASSIGFNPASWAPWLLNSSVCVLEVLVVPSQEDVDGFGASIEALTAEPPGQWVDAGVDYFGGASFSFATWATAGPSCFDVIDTEVCPRDWDNHGSVPSFVVTAFGFLCWSMLVLAVWRFF